MFHPAVRDNFGYMTLIYRATHVEIIIPSHTDIDCPKK